jgi:4-hydroxy-4-methyl-2-oxoglutarate aldolase
MLREELVEHFLRVGTSAMCDADKATRVMDAPIRARSAKVGIFGPAFTVRCRDDFLGVLQAVEAASPGDVIVVDGGEAQIALAGELCARVALVRGLGGIVVDAGYRDMAFVKGCELPIYSRFATPLAGTASKLGELQIAVTCGKVSVSPGDMVLADSDGIVVVDPHRIQTLLELAATMRETEKNLIPQLNADFTLSYGLNLQEHVDALTRGELSSLKFLA